MYGAILGDMVGAPYEFDRGNKTKDFPLFCKYSQFTDDSVMTIAVAEALLDSRFLEDEDFKAALIQSMRKWGRKYPNAGYGRKFYRWLRTKNPEPYGSYGNGSAMRVSPVGHWFKDVDKMLDAAAATALPSHNHEEGIKGAQTVALAIFKARQFGSDASEHIDDILEECVKFSNYDIKIRIEDVINRFDETCQGTVPVALWIIGLSNSFEDAVRRAVSLGADADTLGAIVGSIAEAIWGIPMDIRNIAIDILPLPIRKVVEKFASVVNRK